MDAAVESKSNSASEDNQSNAVIDISDNSWKSSLSVGSLIDCKDKNNMWFQVNLTLQTSLECIYIIRGVSTGLYTRYRGAAGRNKS